MTDHFCSLIVAAMPQSTCDPSAQGLAHRLRTARTAAGVSNAQLAQVCNVHLKTIERWQRSDDHATIPATAIVRIAAALDVDPTWLLVGEHSEVAS